MRTCILAKTGIENVDSGLARAVRTAVVLVMAWGIVFMTGKQHGIQNIAGRCWLFLVLNRFITN